MTANETAPSRSIPASLSGLVNPKRAWGMTGVVFLLYIINYADKALLGIIAQPLARELHLNSAQIGLVGSLFFFMFTIGGFFAGTLNRFLTIRWALVILALLWSVAMLPLVVAASLSTLIISRMLLGLSEGPGPALMHTGVYSWHAPARRGFPSAVIASSPAVAQAAIAPILAWITFEMGWRTAIIALAVAGALWIVLWLTTWSEGPFTKTNRVAPGAVDEEGTEPSVPWSRIFFSRTFLSCAVMIIALYGLSTVVITWLPSYYEVGLGYSALQAGSLFALPATAALIVMLTTGSVTDKLIVRGVRSRVVRIILPCIGVLTCGSILVLLPSISTPALAVAAVTVGYAFAASAFPLINAAISELCPPQQTAGTMGGFLAVMAIGGIIAPYATGLIIDNAATKTIGYAQSFQVIAAIAAIGAILVLIFANPERDKVVIRGAAATPQIPTS